MASHVTPDDLIKLWATPDGQRCTLTRSEAGPPFVVTIWHDQVQLKSLTFDSHQIASECAIAAMNAALSAL